jgi:DNA-binding GntR family transcriptional regulator
VVQQEQALPADLFMDLDRSGPVPLYHQVSTRLESAIQDGILPPGSRLENELALGARLGISRPTIRRAIQQLVDKGLLVRRRGIGTQVVHAKITRNMELTSLFDDLVRAGEKPRTAVLDLEVRAADELSAEALRVEIGSPTLHVRRLRYADEAPLAILENILPSEFIGLESGELETYGLYQVMRGRGVTIQVANQRIGARAATSAESSLLGVPKGGPVLTMSRTAFDNSGRAVEYGQHCYRPDLYSFEVTLVDR